MKEYILKNLLRLMVVTLFVGGIVSCKTPTSQQSESKEEKPKVNYGWLGFPQPCPKPEDAKILVEKWSPKVVKPGEKLQLKLKISNKADYSIKNAKITEKLPENFSIKKITPKPESKNNNNIKWEITNLKSNQSKELYITGKANKVGSLRYTGSTTLDFETKAEGETPAISVIAPNLKFMADAPEKTIIGDKIPVDLVFKNEGSASVKDLELSKTLPEGILTWEGKSGLDMEIPKIDPSGKKEKQINLKGEKPGKYSIELTSYAKDNIKATKTLDLQITKPELKLSLDVPEKRYVGNMIEYDLKLENTGDAPAKNATINLALPEGTSLASVSGNGNSIAGGDKILWNIRSLAPGEYKTVTAKAVAKQILTARAVAKANASAAEKKEMAQSTNIKGISALLCNLDDVHDPVPVGNNETYKISALNQGSLPATKVKVKAELASGMEFVQASGATKARVEGNTVTFEPLPALSPKEKAKWEIEVKATKPGEKILNTKISSEQQESPVSLQEPTSFYK